MRNTLFIILMVVIASSLIATDLPPQSEEVVLGERETIDIWQVKDSAMEEGKLRIQLHREYSKHLDSLLEVEGEILAFNLPELDELNRQTKVTRITRLFSSPALSKKFESRHRQWGLDLWWELHFENSRDIREIVMAYRDLDSIVNWAEPVYKKRLLWTPNDPYFGNQWQYHNTGQYSGTVDKDIDLPEAWNLEKGHPDVIVAVIDGGIQLDHPDLSAMILSGMGYNFVDDNSTIVPQDHGTHVAGIVAASNHNNTGVAGVAGGSNSGDGVRLMSCQVFTNDSSGGFHLAPIYAADNGAAISQNSWGYDEVGVYNQAELTAIDYFNANGGGSLMDGGLTIFAAGNDNDNGAWYPAYYSGAFSVAATNNQDEKSYYSNYGTWVDVSAPGGELNSVGQGGILSTITGSNYANYQGTSMACPHVSGIAALVLSYAHRYDHYLSNSDLRDLIKYSTDDHYAENPSYPDQLGTGRVNAYAALMSLDLGQPSVLITNPSPQSFLDSGSIVNVEATANDIDGSIQRVEFYLDEVLMHTDISAPYAWQWNTSGLATGSYELRAQAVDNEDNSAEHSIEIYLLAPPQEGFESGTFALFPWTNNSAHPWSVQNAQFLSGNYAAQSGNISDNQSTSLSLELEFSVSDNIAFAIKVSSEMSYDFLEFYIDGVEQANWSGEQDWTIVEFPVSAGSRTFTWTYRKDTSVSTGQDRAWIDHLSFLPLADPPQITLSEDNLWTSLTPGAQGSDSFTIGNSGASPLSFSIALQDISQDQRHSSRNIAGSTLSLDLLEYNPGSTLDLTFSVYNASPDDEWLTDVLIDFPAGVTVNSASDFIGGSGGDMSPDQSSGNGITITWHGVSSYGYGYILPGETATATVNVSLNASLSGALEFGYQIQGDVWGADPHSLSGSITVPQMIPELSWLSLSSMSATIDPLDDLQIGLSFDASGLELGSYAALLTISSNDPVNPSQTVEVHLEIISPNTAPTIQLPDSFSFAMNDTLIVDFTPYLHDENGDNLTLTGIDGTDVFFTISELVVSFTATPDWYGSENLSFTVSDGNLEATDTVLMIVNQVITELDSPQLSISNTEAGILISWNSIENATRYDIYRSLNPDAGYEYLGSSIELNFLDADALHKAFYRVIAVYEEDARYKSTTR